MRNSQNQTVETSVSCQSTKDLIEAINHFQKEVGQHFLTRELLDAYVVVVNSKEYSDGALEELFFTIKETLALTAELSRIVNHFTNLQNQAI